MPLNLPEIRRAFDAFAETGRGRPPIHFDGPAGTQVPRRVVERMADCLVRHNANLGGAFATSREAGDLVDAARQAIADLLNAASAEEIVFGQNMTSLTFHVSRSICRSFRRGDEIVLSRMDHDANVAPWLYMARECGLVVKWLDFDPETFEFDLAALVALMGDRTRLVAVGYASNVTGTVNDVAGIARIARSRGALTYIDAVQFAPHGLIDVQALGCDCLALSCYKCFGPHQGVLWMRGPVLAALPAYKVRPAADRGPDKFETGTQSHEGLAGVAAMVDYLCDLGGAGPRRAGESAPAARRRHLEAAFAAVREHEAALAAILIGRLRRVRGLRIFGITDRGALCRRVPTVSFTVAGHAPDVIASRLADLDVFVWSGNHYAVEPIRRLGLGDEGVVRWGLAHYSLEAEVHRAVDALEAIST